MKLAILSRNSTLYSTRRLVEAARERIGKRYNVLAEQNLGSAR